MEGVYGSSLLLFSLRKNLVLKRLQTAPVRGSAIVACEMLSRLFFHVISFIIMIALGYFVFGFTLVSGLTTFIEMLVFRCSGYYLYGDRVYFSGVVQSENAIAPIANTVVLPQILLCALFFPINNNPRGMQQFCSVLPLTLFVDGSENSS